MSSGLATAGAILEFSPVHIEVVSSFRNASGNTLIEFDGGDVAPDDPEAFSALVLPPDMLRFPTSPSSLPGGFVSSAFSGKGEGGVGLSGIVIRSSAAANARYEQSIDNLGNDASGPLIIDYEIPRLEAAIIGGEGNPDGPNATASARLLALVFDDAGSELSRDTVFEYFVGIHRLPPGSGDAIIASDDLLDDRGEGSLLSEGGAQGITYAAFEGTRRLPSIPAGGRLRLSYQFGVAADTALAESGFQAFVGDPFQISGSSGFEIRLADPTAVPEPASLVLMPGAVVAMLLVRRRRHTS